MGGIEKLRHIDLSKLNGEFYFQTLLEEAYNCQLLIAGDIERVQFECLGLLAKSVEKYNKGSSSSIRVEAAQSIMASNLYTISLYLKTLGAEPAVKAIKEAGIPELYDKGRNCLEALLIETRTLHYKVLNNMPEINNTCYNDTLADGIKGFFKIYNPDFQAQEIHITADYPLYFPVKNLAGIEFIQKYLESVYYENTFCLNFSPENIHYLLSGYEENYTGLIFNIFEPILATSAGCVLASESPRGLNLSEDNFLYLKSLLAGKGLDELASIFMGAYESLIDIFNISDGLAARYIKESLVKLAPGVKSSIDLEVAKKLFVTPKYPEANPKLYFSYGVKMNDARFRKIIDKIIQSSNLSDKLLIIKNYIHSLADLEDVLLNASFDSHEIIAVLKGLSMPEIAALSKKYPYGAIDLRSEEQQLTGCLHEYMSSMPEGQQKLLMKAIDMLEIEP